MINASVMPIKKERCRIIILRRATPKSMITKYRGQNKPPLRFISAAGPVLLRKNNPRARSEIPLPGQGATAPLPPSLALRAERKAQRLLTTEAQTLLERNVVGGVVVAAAKILHAREQVQLPRLVRMQKYTDAGAEPERVVARELVADVERRLGKGVHHCAVPAPEREARAAVRAIHSDTRAAREARARKAGVDLPRHGFEKAVARRQRIDVDQRQALHRHAAALPETAQREVHKIDLRTLGVSAARIQEIVISGTKLDGLKIASIFTADPHGHAPRLVSLTGPYRRRRRIDHSGLHVDAAPREQKLTREPRGLLARTMTVSRPVTHERIRRLEQYRLPLCRQRMQHRVRRAAGREALRRREFSIVQARETVAQPRVVGGAIHHLRHHAGLLDHAPHGVDGDHPAAKTARARAARPRDLAQGAQMVGAVLVEKIIIELDRAELPRVHQQHVDLGLRKIEAGGPGGAGRRGAGRT